MTTDTVAITIDADSPAMLVPAQEAKDLYERYTALTLTHPMDLKLFAALTVALGVLPKPSLVYAPGEETLAERKLREWRARQ